MLNFQGANDLWMDQSSTSETPGCCSAGALTTTTISQCFSWKQCSKINWHKSHKLWQIHANTIEIWWNLPEHPYSFDISIYLRSTPETHPTIFAQRALKSWVSNKFLFEEQGNVQHAKELESVEKVWESFCIGAVRWKKNHCCGSICSSHNYKYPPWN